MSIKFMWHINVSIDKLLGGYEYMNIFNNANSAPRANLGLGNKKILAGYWYEWTNETSPRHTDPASIPLAYNMIVVAFLETRPDGIPTFAPMPGYMSDQEFINAVNLWKSQGREVIISLGGELGKVALRMDQKQAFKDETRRIFNKYGFTGYDIDLEGSSINAADNYTVIPQVLNELKAEFNAQGRQFLITMAPEFPLLHANETWRSYVPFLQNTNYDLIFPQYYNQGAAGIWTPEFGYISQTDQARKGQFLYALTKDLITGQFEYNSFIPADKLAIGLPAAPNSTFTPNNGYVEDPAAVQYALTRLRNEGYDIRGLMTWSINQDENNGWEFVRRYAPMLNLTGTDPWPGGGSGGGGGGTTPPITPPPTRPNVPTNVRLVSQTENSNTIAWDPPLQAFSSPNILSYNIYRDGIRISSVSNPQTTFTDSNLPASSGNCERIFCYSVTAVNVAGESDFSNNFCFARPPVIPPIIPGIPDWSPFVNYSSGDVVKHNGPTYIASRNNIATEPGVWSPY